MAALLKATKENKVKALNKMLEEMNDKHTAGEDAIHNWLCDQDDPELIDGILKDGKTIKRAMQYVFGKAKKQSTGNMAMVADKTVFKWVREYYLSADAAETEEIKAEVIIPEDDNRNAMAPPESRVNDAGEEQLNLLDFL